MTIEQGNEQQSTRELRLSPFNLVSIGGLAVAGIGHEFNNTPVGIVGFAVFIGGAITAVLHERRLNS